MNIETRPQVRRTDETKTGIVDCDIHPSPKSLETEVFPFLTQHWRDYIAAYGMTQRIGFQSGTQFPKGQPRASRRDSFPPNGGGPGSDLAFMREQHLDKHNVEMGVMIPLRIGQAMLKKDLAIAVCSAINDWQIEFWTSKEPRLKGSVVMAYENPEACVAEIERHAGRPDFVQVSMLSRMPEPMGHRKYWPIYEAAADAGLAVGVHAFGYGGHPSTGGGHPSYYIEDMMAHSQNCASLVTSMVFEGVFEHIPKLKLVIVEGGIAWLPALAWRLDRIWERNRLELSDLKHPPSHYIRNHIWLTSQPIEEPDNREQLVEAMEWIGWDRFLYASDYPHWDYDDPDQALPARLTKAQRDGFFRENALRAYGMM
ncbi:MAG: amidohydrolase family protein [Pseudooceanicola sp.]